MINNIFKDQAYRLLLRTIKNEITEELRELQSDVIFIKDAKNKIRNFQSILAKRVKPYFNHKCEHNGETIRKIKTPYNSYTRTTLPRVGSFDNFFDESFSKETLEENYHKKIKEIRRRVQNYFEKDLKKKERYELKQWTTDSRTLIYPVHSIDKFRFNAICSQTVFNYLMDTADVSDYVISCMYLQVNQINTWQYASNKYLRTDCERYLLCDGGDLNHEEMGLMFPLEHNYHGPSFSTLEFHTNYKLPRLIGMACKKEALNNLDEIDYLLGISL